ncbi:MAG: hypothetical protein HY833_01125 [Candidatus Aenigmarchaeota archaeon]|nr:hypothetical protein [Candidatus Aenigmarchaeota archaeon]
MNLEKSLYSVDKIAGSLGKESKESAEIVKLTSTYLGKESGLKPIIDIIKGYVKGKRSFKDEEVLALAGALGDGVLDRMYKDSSGYLSKNPTYGKARKVAEEMKKSASYMKNLGKKLMNHIGKYNLGQLYKIEDLISGQKKQAADSYSMYHKGIVPYIKKYTKN